MNIKEDTLTAIHAHFMQMESQVRIKVLVAFYGGNAVYGLPEDERLRCVYYVYHGSYHPQEEIDGIEYKGYHVSDFLTSLPQGHYYRIAHMPVVYVGDADFCKQLTALLPKCFLESVYLKANWSKRYNFHKPFDRIRKRLSCKWVYERHTMPPLNIYSLVEGVVDNDEIKGEIYEVLRK